MDILPSGNGWTQTYVPSPRETYAPPSDSDLDDDGDDLDDSNDDDPSPSAPLTGTLKDLIEHLRARRVRAITINAHGYPGNSRTDQWIPCPIHPSDWPAIRLETRANGIVWVHPSWESLPQRCSCTPSQIIAGHEIRDPRVVPAGTVVTDEALRELTATSVREMYSAITWDNAAIGQADWLDEPLIERGQFTSIYGPAGIGKSLLAQERAARLASRGTRVLYIDAENPMSEVKARLGDMGWTAADLANLTYLSFPSLPPLDTPSGAAKLAMLVDAIGPQLVVLDTWSKFLSGDEASPSTHTKAYNLSILPLRRRGLAVQAIDHSGKDPARGPRGGSSKVDNVDTLWLVTLKTGGQLRLERRKSRTGRGPDLVELVRRTGPLRHDRVDLAPADVLSPEVRECVAKLDALEVPSGWGRDRAAEVLRANDYRVRNQVLAEAVKVRRERGAMTADSLDLSPDLGDSRGQVASQDPGTGRGQITE